MGLLQRRNGAGSRPNVLLLVGLIVIGVWSAISLTGLLPNRTVPAFQGPGTVTPVYPHPISTEQEAISRTVELSPGAYAMVARLVDFGTVNSWRGFGSIGSHEAAPAWLVAVLERNITVRDVAADLPGFSAGGSAAGELAINGAYYVWDANGGHLKALGALDESSPQSYSSIVALVSLPLTPEPATEIPPVPRPTGGPEYFWVNETDVGH